jgi:hypothetical protein
VIRIVFSDFALSDEAALAATDRDAFVIRVIFIRKAFSFSFFIDLTIHAVLVTPANVKGANVRNDGNTLPPKPNAEVLRPFFLSENLPERISEN